MGLKSAAEEPAALLHDKVCPHAAHCSLSYAPHRPLPVEGFLRGLDFFQPHMRPNGAWFLQITYIVWVRGRGWQEAE